MTSRGTEPVLIISPRYADDVAAAVTAAGMVARVERRAEQSAQRFAAEPVRVVVVDARGALAQGMAVAKALGALVEGRRGAMLVLLSRVDASAARSAHDAGATSVLVSPFGAEAFGDALRLTSLNARRLAEAATDLHGGEAELAVSARGHDQLTGLATGDRLQSWIAMLLAAADPPQPVFVLAIGVGRFAPINAAYGRAIADRVLIAVAERLGQIIDRRGPGRPAEARLLARLGGAEFAVAIAGPVAMSDARRLADLMARAFEVPFSVDGHVIHLSGRIGIAAGQQRPRESTEDSAAALIRWANAALASAREGDAGRIDVFEPDPAGDPLTRRANLQSDLHRAIEHDDIVLLFQPQLSLASGLLSGVEALARWEHPELGLLPAETLLATATSADLAIRLGRLIRARAMAIAADWSGPLAMLKLSLNVTAADLADPGFAQALESALEASGLARGRLVLEVTEGALIDDMHGAVHLLEGLRRTGIAVALDDFGTGYSSLAWMARLPIDAIKLDRSFSLGLTSSPRERLVVETVVRLSKQLGLGVIAEGIETDPQLAAARRAGCDAVQGYHIAPPLRAARLEGFCLDWSGVAAGS